MRKSATTFVAGVMLPAILSWPGLAAGQTDLERFPLLKAVPADAFIVVAARGNPERAFLDDYWTEVGQAFWDSGIIENVWDKITERIPDEKLVEADKIHDRVVERCGRIDWGGLFDREMIYAGRLITPATGGLRYEGLLIGRMDAKGAARNYEELKDLLGEFKNVAALWSSADAIAFEETKENGVSMAAIGAAGIPELGLAVAQRGDLIFVSIAGDAILQDALALLGGESSKQRMVDSPRFKEAFANLPPAEDTVVFWDVEGMVGPMRQLFSGIARPKKTSTQVSTGGIAGATPEDTGETPGPHGSAGASPSQDAAAVWLGFAATILDEVSILDYTASVEWTEGRRVLTESVTRMRPEAKTSGLGRLMSSGEPVADWAKFIPKEAESFSATSGVDFAGVYRYIVDLAGRLPRGSRFIEVIEEKLQGLGFNPAKDSALLEGSFTRASLEDGWFVLLKVRDQKKAGERLDEILARFGGPPEEGGMLMVSDVRVGEEKGFKQVSHPFMVYLGGIRPPVVGCAEGYMLVASSAKTAELCLATGRGKHPNITAGKRWKKESLSPKAGPVDSIHFTDERNMSEKLQAKISWLSGGFAMVAMLAQGASAEFRGLMSQAAEMLEILRPVAAKLDFYQSSAGYTTFDGWEWRSREVQNYKSAEVRPSSRPTTRPAKPLVE